MASGFFAGAEMSTRLAPPLVMCSSALSRLVKEAGGFANDIHAEAAPRQRGGVALLEDFDRMPPDDDVLLVVPDFAVETPVDAVPFEQVGEGLGVGQVVDGGDVFDLGLAHGAENVAPDAAEAVDSEFWHILEEIYEN